MAPQKGIRYTKEEIESFVSGATGWNTPDEEAPLGVTYYDYFDANGTYLGPDDDGLEPCW